MSADRAPNTDARSLDRSGLSSTLDRLAALLARWPWWAFIILVGLVAAFYSMSTNEIYRRAFAYVTDNPQVSTNRIANVRYAVKQSDGSTSEVSGTLIDDNGSTYKVITQDEVDITVPRSEIASLSCDSDATGATCGVGSKVALVRQSAGGKLVFETLGAYTINTAFGSQQILKIAAFTERETDPVSHPVRTPEGCSADPNGGCDIVIKLKTDRPENQVVGNVTIQTVDAITVQTVPPITVTIPKADVAETLLSKPAQCALNNPAGCDTGPFLTLWVTVIAFALAVVVGLIVGLMRVSTNAIFFNLSTVYVEVIRGIPLLVILLFFGFAIEPWFHANFGRNIGLSFNIVIGLTLIAVGYLLVTRRTVLRTDPVELLRPILMIAALGVLGVIAINLLRGMSQELDPNRRAIQSAIVGLAIGYGAFLAELFRAGIQSIGKGQMEAARSLGMNYIQAMRFVILPQAFRVILPPLGNDFIAMLKDSSLIAILAVPELTQLGRLSASNTYRPFETYVTLAVLYLCMTLFLSLTVRIVERRVALPR
jgi:polar amino acid transport system permease protein